MASKPTYRGSATAAATSVSSLAISYASQVGSLLAVGVFINDGSFVVTAITDSAGSVGGSPVNDWRLISAHDFAAGRLELWACKPQTAITSLTVLLGGNQSLSVTVGEYTNVAAYSVSSTLEVSSAQNPNPALAIQIGIAQTPPQSSCMMLAFFGDLADNFTATTHGTSRLQSNNASPEANIALVDSAIADSSGQLRCTKVTTQLATAGNLAASNLQAVSLMLSSGLALSEPPGFSDLPDSVLDAEKPALGTHLAAISNNSAFGMVRLEVFVGTYADGETVDIPQSPVDGYVYSRDELIYAWGLFTTANKDTGWISAKDTLWYALWDVNQATGVVTSKEFYRRSTENAGTETSDGILQVFVIAQRQKNALVMASSPGWVDIVPASFYQDKAEATSLMKRLNQNSKYGVVSTEAIDMGEFTDGGTVPLPVSPVDGYAYSRQEVQYVFSWRWTTDGAAFTQPAYARGQLGPLHCSINTTTGAVQVKVEMVEIGGALVTESGWGRIKVTALCQRGVIFGYEEPVSDVVTSFSTENDFRHLVTAVLTWLPKTDDYIVASTSGGTVLGFTYIFKFTNETLDEPPTGNLQQVGSTFSYMGGDPPLTVPIPAGATRIDQTNGAPSFEGVVITRYSTELVVPPYGSATLADDFAELSQDLFMPGSTLRAVTAAQMQLNAAEAAASPEFFASAVHKNGDTVPLVISPWDGYKYTRSEMTYFWEWSDTTPHEAGGTHQRTPLFFAHVDPDTGLCTVQVWRLAEGGPYVSPEIDGGRITVTVMGFRNSQRSTPAAMTANPPSDAGTAMTDSGTGDTINGV